MWTQAGESHSLSLTGLETAWLAESHLFLEAQNSLAAICNFPSLSLCSGPKQVLAYAQPSLFREQWLGCPQTWGGFCSCHPLGIEPWTSHSSRLVSVLPEDEGQ
jgi:hypothetical protein